MQQEKVKKKNQHQDFNVEGVYDLPDSVTMSFGEMPTKALNPPPTVEENEECECR